jgi:small GTP-binding protein
VADDFAYDVFLCHAPRDRATAEDIADRLMDAGLRVWWEGREVRPRAKDRAAKVAAGLEQSRTLVLLWSKNAAGRAWPKLERQTALFRNPSDASRRFVPVRLDETPVPTALEALAFIELRGRGDCAQLQALCSPPRKERRCGTILHSIAILQGHTAWVGGVAVTPDGRRAVSGSYDDTLRVWDLGSYACLATLQGHTSTVNGVAVTPDGRRAVSTSEDDTLRVWDLGSHACLATLRGHTSTVYGVAVTPDGRRAVSASWDTTLRVWDLGSHACLATLQGHTNVVYGVAVTPDGRRAVSASLDETLRVWDLGSCACLATLGGHTQGVWGVAVTPDARRAVSASQDGTLRVWDLGSYACLATLQGHTGLVCGVAVTLDGRRAVSASYDGTLRVWDLGSYACLAALGGHTQGVHGVAVTPDGRRTVASIDKTLRVWDLSPLGEPAPEATAATRYTNAKVLLVGDTGVGKTGLALRLTKDDYQPTSSTDGVWATHMPLPATPATAGTEHEVWLWDFAGQSDYRLIHQLFLDETALAVLVFNPQSNNPFDGLAEWDRALTRAARRPFRKLLVAGRCDRGGLTVSADLIERFRQEKDFASYLPTSALTGDGCKELHQAIVDAIDWTGIPLTSSPAIFRRLRDTIVGLRDEGVVLLRMSELRQRLEVALVGDGFTADELTTVVRLLARPGLVWQLEFGDIVLLRPELINTYAAAVVRTVREHAEDIGVIAEQDVLAGRLRFADLKRLPPAEEKVVLLAMNQTFVEHGLCLREDTEQGALLVFPSYFKRERPELGEHPAVLVTYQFGGALDEVYATLVVCLLHTRAFTKDQLWRDAADFKTPAGNRLGLKMARQGEGRAEIAVYFDANVSDDAKVLFIRYVHDHLKAKDPELTRVRYYECPNCGAAPDLVTVRARLTRALKDIVCPNCEVRVPLLDLIEEQFPTDELTRKVRELEEAAKTGIDSESKDLILVGHAFTITAEAGHIYRGYTNSDHGIDGEIEFKNDHGEASGKMVYLQLKSGDSYLYKRKSDGAEVFTIKKRRWATYWQSRACDVMLVIRTSDGVIRWMNVTEHLKRQSEGGKKAVKQIVFSGEPFNAYTVRRMRDRLIPPPPRLTYPVVPASCYSRALLSPLGGAWAGSEAGLPWAQPIVKAALPSGETILPGL